MTSPRPLARAARAAGVLAVLVAAAAGGRAVAGPPTPPRVLPAPGCPAVLGDALPRTWPSSTYLVPWGPVSGRVCAYPTGGRPTPQTAPVGRTSTLDPTVVAQVAGVVEDLPAASPRCTDGTTVAASGPDAGVVVLLLRYRPGATPTVGDELRLVVRRTGACLTVSNGLRTAELSDAAVERLLDLAPPLATVLPRR